MLGWASCRGTTYALVNVWVFDDNVEDDLNRRVYATVHLSLINDSIGIAGRGSDRRASERGDENEKKGGLGPDPNLEIEAGGMTR